VKSTFSMKTISIAGRVKVLMVFQAAVISFLLLAGSVAFATESGGGSYPNGAEDFMSGAIPPPGFYFLNYMSYYYADKFKDGNGNSAVPDFHLKAAAEVLRVVYTTKHQLFGGYWSMQAIVPLVNLDVKVPVGHESRTGLGDIDVSPFLLSWHSKNWHFATGFEVILPVGNYDKTHIANIGRNYWTFEPEAAFTYISDSGIEISSKFIYDINTKNTDTDYRSGQEFHFDYTLGYHIKNWSLGAGGYYYKQITDDKQYGAKVGNDGNRGQVFAIGPQIKYDYKNMSFLLKYQKEMAVENKPDGSKAWFKFVYAF